MIVTVSLLFGGLQYLNNYTHHGEEISVPNLIGMSKNDLMDSLNPKSLQFVILDSTYIQEEEKGIVLAQNPKAMSMVKMNRTIYVSVNAMNPPSVKMPLVIDKSLRQASSVLGNIGLNVGELIYVPDQCVNCVLGQLIDSVEVLTDTIVPKGTIVDLVLGGGLSDEKILVPLLINLTRDEAAERLKSSFLNLGAELYDGSVFDDEDSVSAKIFAQHPQYSGDSWVYMGSSVDVELTKMETKIDTTIPILDSSLIVIPLENDTSIH